MSYEIPKYYYPKLKEGADYTNKKGNTISNELLTSAPAKEVSYAYCADTLFTTSFLSFIQDVHTIYHESTYLSDNEVKATERFHSTAAQAAQIALLANARQLLIGHFSSRYNELQPFLDEAQAVFPNTAIADCGVKFSLKWDDASNVI